MSRRLGVLISGRGSNLQSIIDAIRLGELLASIAVVISNRPEAAGLLRAQEAGLDTLCLRQKDYESRDAYDAALAGALRAKGVDLVCLAGFMRLVGKPLLEAFHNRMLNIHPSLLPKYRGVHTHERALAAGETEHGVSIHFVTPELDGGPVFLQATVPVLPGDDADTLAARVLVEEHKLYPLAIRWFAEGRVRLDGDTVLFDGAPLTAPKRLDDGA